uniref:Small ribosomal subunit protein bS20c n=1 Tax=Liagoropsis maxima TaxID=1653392 RepID=A0A1G4NVR5_9FLOR|nr:Ribosomal protein S20 [Liagoropsis maxima]SCW22781.1 Ribosomal protein S20 [Liagoropsis maxima]
MAKNMSVMKSIAIANRNKNSNKVYKSTIKTLTKKLLLDLKKASTTDDIKLLQGQLSMIYSTIDKAVKRGVLHRNNAARKKSFLSKIIKAGL